LHQDPPAAKLFIEEENVMKKARPQKLTLNRETLRRLMSDELARIYGNKATDTGNWCSIPSCIDGCPSAMCPTTIVGDGRD
jgi:hypothetical protein